MEIKKLCLWNFSRSKDGILLFQSRENHLLKVSPYQPLSAFSFQMLSFYILSHLGGVRLDICLNSLFFRREGEASQWLPQEHSEPGLEWILYSFTESWSSINNLLRVLFSPHCSYNNQVGREFYWKCEIISKCYNRV